MGAKKLRIVIIGAGMAGLTAANKLYTTAGFKDKFELCVVEGGARMGGRINTTEFGGDRIEMGATWIHGIGDSPVHKIAREIHALHSEQPWECMDGFLDDPITIAEGGFELNPSIVEPISNLFKNLMDFAQAKKKQIQDTTTTICTPTVCGFDKLSIGSFLRKGLDLYWVSMNNNKNKAEELNGYDGKWSKKLLEEAIFAMHENTQRTYTSAGDLLTLDYNAESEYIMFPGEEITIAKGYLSIIESLASVLPPGTVQLGKKVKKIEWQIIKGRDSSGRPVKLHFCDGSSIFADHVIVTVSLGVLKAGIHQDSGMFDPPLPRFKTEAISRLGFGVVNKLFLQASSGSQRIDQQQNGCDFNKFLNLHIVFHRSDSELRQKKIPWWMRRTASLCPIYHNSSVLLSWFAGEEALELEKLGDEEIISGVSTTLSNFLPHSSKKVISVSNSISHLTCNGNVNVNPEEKSGGNEEVKFTKVLKSKWGNDPLFLGSYSYVAVGSSGDDLDTISVPLPNENSESENSEAPPPPLQILFAGEATHRTHYSTTHGAYLSGLREANRLLQHYNFVGL